jgi:hypothetical protein
MDTGVVACVRDDGWATVGEHVKSQTNMSSIELPNFYPFGEKQYQQRIHHLRRSKLTSLSMAEQKSAVRANAWSSWQRCGMSPSRRLDRRVRLQEQVRSSFAVNPSKNMQTETVESLGSSPSCQRDLDLGGGTPAHVRSKVFLC